jgi:hypothetical protein
MMPKYITTHPNRVLALGEDQLGVLEAAADLLPAQDRPGMTVG